MEENAAEIKYCLAQDGDECGREKLVQESRPKDVSISYMRRDNKVFV